MLLKDYRYRQYIQKMLINAEQSPGLKLDGVEQPL